MNAKRDEAIRSAKEEAQKNEFVLETTQKKDPIIVKSESLSGFSALKKRLSEIKAKDLSKNRYFISNSESSLGFMSRTYKKTFFTVARNGEWIELNALTNGVRRALSYSRKTDDEALLQKLLPRIERRLNAEGRKKHFRFSIIPNERDHSKRFYYIQISYIRSDASSFIGDGPGECALIYDKKTWSYVFESIKGPWLKEAMSIVSRVFYKSTSSTRRDRKARHEAHS